MSLQIELKKSAVSQKQPFPSDLALGEIALNYNADGPFLTCKDTAGNIRKLTGVWVGASAPSSPTAGDPWLDTTSTPVLKIYNGSTWVSATSVAPATTSAYGTVRLATAADITNGTAGKVVDAAQLASRITADISTALAADPFTVPTLSVTGNATVTGNLTVNGTQTIINTQTLDVEDRNIVLGNVSSPTDTTANTGGITLKGATDKTFNWLDATDSWTSSEHVDLASGKSYRINGTEVLSDTALGSGVTDSSLTSVGIIGTGTWEGTELGADYGGTGYAGGYSNGQLLIGNAASGLTRATITPGDGIDITNGDGAITIAADLKANGGLVIESTELAVDLGASAITGTLAVSDGGTGQTGYTDGELLIGKTDGSLTKATLTAGSNISITNGDGTITIASSYVDTTYTAGDGIDLTGSAFSVDAKANGGIVIESGELAVDLGASAITGTLAVGDGGTGQTGFADGELLIGKTDGSLAKATLTAGDNVTITNGDGVITVAAATPLFASYAIISDTKTQNTPGGTFTSGAWRTRDLNTKVADPDGIVSIASNQFTLGAGTYLIKWSAPAVDATAHQSRLSDGSNFYYGKSVLTSNGNTGFSAGSARVTIASSTAFTIEHRCSAGVGATCGYPANFGPEVYTTVEIYKEA